MKRPYLLLVTFLFLFALQFLLTTTPAETRRSRPPLTGDTLPTDIYPGDTFIKTGSAAGFYYSVVRGVWIGPVLTQQFNGGTVANATTFSSTTTHTGKATFNGGADFAAGTFNFSGATVSNLPASGLTGNFNPITFGSTTGTKISVGSDAWLAWDNTTKVYTVGPVPSGSPAQSITIQPAATFSANATVAGTATLQGQVIASDATHRARLDGGIDLKQGGAGGVAFASLPTVSDGVIVYCTDCTEADPCAGSGTGSIAKKIHSRWKCN
jgi:hypothetical protein